MPHDKKTKIRWMNHHNLLLLALLSVLLDSFPQAESAVYSPLNLRIKGRTMADMATASMHRPKSDEGWEKIDLMGGLEPSFDPKSGKVRFFFDDDG